MRLHPSRSVRPAANPAPTLSTVAPVRHAQELAMRNEDPSVEVALKGIAGILATAYQRYVKVMRIPRDKSDKELDNSAVSSPHVVDARRNRR